MKNQLWVSSLKEDEINSISHLSIEGEKLSAITLDSTVVLFFGQEREFELRILEEEFEIVLGGQIKEINVCYSAWSIPPQKVAGITCLSMLINKVITLAEISEVGVLRIILEDGSSINVKPGGTYEAYTLVGAGEMIVCNGNGIIA